MIDASTTQQDRTSAEGTTALVVAGFSHPAVENFLRQQGEPAPASGSNIWTTQRYSALPLLRDRLAQARQELDAIENKIKRESAC